MIRKISLYQESKYRYPYAHLKSVQSWYPVGSLACTKIMMYQSLFLGQKFNLTGKF